MKSFVIAFVYLILFPGWFQLQAQEQPEAFIRAVEGPQQGEIGQFPALSIEDLLKEHGVPGVSVAVIKDFEIHWAKGYGTADVETGAPVQKNTLFQAASISKPVAAMAVLKAVQDSFFSLDQDINSILTSWQLPAGTFTAVQPVTPRSLTSHTSGLGDGFGFPGYKPDAPLPTLVQIMEGASPSNVGQVSMERPPMVAMKYSGGGVTLMQLALSDAVGQPFQDIAKTYVLDPLGMEDSGFDQPLSPERDRQAARAHNRVGRGMGAKWHVYPEQAAAGLWTTPTDLALFAVEVQKSIRGGSNQVLDRAHALEMVNPVGVGPFAVGFAVEKSGEGWYFQHSGANWGFKCNLVAHKVKGYGLAIMTNAINGHMVMREILDRVVEVYGWDMYDDPVPR